MPDGKMWVQYDRFGNELYLTYERWEHITDLDNHPEIELYSEDVQETIRVGRRRQDPYGYRYYRSFPGLPEENTHVVVCVRVRWATKPDWQGAGGEVCNNGLLSILLKGDR